MAAPTGAFSRRAENGGLGGLLVSALTTDDPDPDRQARDRYSEETQTCDRQGRRDAYHLTNSNADSSAERRSDLYYSRDCGIG